jgi:hypothetical protein
METEWCAETRGVTVGEWIGTVFTTILCLGLPLLSSRIREIIFTGSLTGYQRIVTKCDNCTYIIPHPSDVLMKLDPPWKGGTHGHTILSRRFMRMFGGRAQAGDIIIYQITTEDPRRIRNTLCYKLDNILTRSASRQKGLAGEFYIEAVIMLGPSELRTLSKGIGFWQKLSTNPDPVAILVSGAAPSWVISRYIEREDEVRYREYRGSVSGREVTRLHEENNCFLVENTRIPSQDEVERKLLSVLV